MKDYLRAFFFLATFLAAFFFFFAIVMAPCHEHPDSHHTFDPSGALGEGSNDDDEPVFGRSNTAGRDGKTGKCPEISGKNRDSNPRSNRGTIATPRLPDSGFPERSPTPAGLATVAPKRTTLPAMVAFLATFEASVARAVATWIRPDELVFPMRCRCVIDVVHRVDERRVESCRSEMWPMMAMTVKGRFRKIIHHGGIIRRMETPLKLAIRMKSLEPSATLAMAARAQSMAASGIDVVDLSVGEPDFPTPEHVCRAAESAIRAGKTKYTPAAGIPELRKAVAADYARRTGLAVAASQVVVSNGAKHALHNVFTAVLDEGDEVIMPAPYWVSYAELIKLAGGKPVLLPTTIEEDFKLSPAALERAITPATRMLLLCSPSNPTGVVYSADELRALADVAIARDLSVVSDEIYDQLVFDGREAVSFPTLRPGLFDRTIVVAGVSKTYSMTGWRIGWTIAPEHLSKAIANLQSQETSNPSSVSQHAAIAALVGPQECVAEMRLAFQRRRDLVASRLAAMPGIRLPRIGGAFYAFFEIPGRSQSMAWCERLLEKEHVALVPGVAFGAEGHARMSFAASEEKLADGLARIERFVSGA